MISIDSSSLGGMIDWIGCFRQRPVATAGAPPASYKLWLQ